MAKLIHPARRVTRFLSEEACIPRTDLDERIAKVFPDRSIGCQECAGGKIALIYNDGASVVVYKDISEFEALCVMAQKSKPSSLLEDEIGSAGGNLTDMFHQEFTQFLEIQNISEAKLFYSSRIKNGFQDSTEFRFLLICAIVGNIARMVHPNAQWYFEIDGNGLLNKLLLMSETHLMDIGEEVSAVMSKAKFSLRLPQLVDYLQILPHRWRKRDRAHETGGGQLQALNLSQP